MTATGIPVEMSWDGKSLRPVSPYWDRRAQKEFVAGEIYHVVDQPERSQKAHARYFARVKDAWASLPPLLAEQYPTAEHFRKSCLVKAGYCTTQHMACGTAAEARKLAAFIRPLDKYAVISVAGSVVYVFRAESQSYRSMGKKRFNESVEAVEGVIENLLMVSRGELSMAGEAA